MQRDPATDIARFGLGEGEIEPIGGLTLLWRAFRFSPRETLRAIGWLCMGMPRRARNRLRGLVGPARRGDYRQWLGRQVPATQGSEQALTNWPYTPTVSVVQRIDQDRPPDPLRFNESTRSVLQQSYPHTKLTIAASAAAIEPLKGVIAAIAADRVRIVEPAESPFAALINAAASNAQEDILVFLGAEDRLADNACFEIARLFAADPTAVLAYSDQDLFDENSIRYDPLFKPDFNEEYLLGINYIGNLLAVRKPVFERMGGLSSAYPGAEFHDFLLRLAAAEGPDRIKHIPKILYHWRVPRAGFLVDTALAHRTREARRGAVEAHLARRSIDAVAELGPTGLVRIKRRLPVSPPLVSLIVPTRDSLTLLHECVEGLLHRTDYPSLELIIVDNGSTEASTLAYLQHAAADPRVQVLTLPGPFNYSRLNNHAVGHSRGDIIAFINNDIEVIEGHWLSEMVSHAIRPEIGAVGAKLLYADGRIQHGGIILGLGGVAGHAHRFFPRAHAGYMHRLRVPHYVSAVTAACLVIDKSKFLAVGGFDENDFGVTLNDVDLCLKLDAAGYRNLWTPHAELYHKESASRPSDAAFRQAPRWRRERARCVAKWGPALQADRYYNPNLTLRSEDFSLP